MNQSRQSILFTLLFAIAFCLLAPPTVRAQRKSITRPPATEKSINRPIADKWALVIGIGKYQDESIRGLRFPAKDAEDFKTFLIEQANFKPDHVRILTDENATRMNILSELGDTFLPRVVKPDDLVVIFISSHGSSSKSDIRQKNFLITYDTVSTNLFGSAIEMQNLTEMIQDRVRSDRVLLVLDACHSGATKLGEKAAGHTSTIDLSKIPLGAGQLVICSSKPDESSWELSKYTNGVFTKKLIEGFMKNGPKTTVAQAFQYTKSTVLDEVQVAEGVSQTPVLKSMWKGNDLMLRLPPSAPRAVPVAVRNQPRKSFKVYFRLGDMNGMPEIEIASHSLGQILSEKLSSDLKNSLKSFEVTNEQYHDVFSERAIVVNVDPCYLPTLDDSASISYSIKVYGANFLSSKDFDFGGLNIPRRPFKRYDDIEQYQNEQREKENKAVALFIHGHKNKWIQQMLPWIEQEILRAIQEIPSVYWDK